MSRYYLIKANDMKKTEFVGEYYFDLQQEPVELTKEELEHLQYFNNHSWCGNDSYKDLAKELGEKLRKVLE